MVQTRCELLCVSSLCICVSANISSDKQKRMLLWISLATCCLAVHAQPQYGGPVQFGPPQGSRGPSVAAKAQQQAFQAPRFSPPGQTFSIPQGFRPAPVHDNNDLGPSSPSPLLLVTPHGSPSSTRSQRPPQPSQATQQYASPTPAPQQFRAVPQQQQQRRPAQQQPQQTRAYQQQTPSNRGAQRPGVQQLEQELDEEELEEPTPDRLTELLPLSKFTCGAKNTGYYADTGLDCEVFHYCQDGAKHSWVCPDGFTFHQVHLICMPPSHDNICQKSSDYFFVNDYLYRPLNAEEARTRPNVTLRYSDRYYPENYENEDEGQQAAQHHVQQQQQQQQRAQPAQPAQSTRGRQPSAQRPSNQVFHSPEAVNIPLQQRRAPSPTPQPQRPQYETDEYEYDDFPYRQQQG